MTATLFSPAPRVDRAPSDVDVGMPTLCLGDAPALSLLLAAAQAGGAGESDGLLVAFEDWPDDTPPGAFDLLWQEGLRGRPVGLIALAADLGQGARTLAHVHALVRQHGGLPVGAGRCVDSADVVSGEYGPAFGDVTLPASLALLGQRVRTLARSRRILRAA